MTGTPAVSRTEICLFSDECLATPCLNEGVCQKKAGVVTCLCPNDYEGHKCQDKKTSDASRLHIKYLETMMSILLISKFNLIYMY